MPLLKRSHSKAQTYPRFWQQRIVWVSLTGTICITMGSIVKDAIAPVAVQAVPLRTNVMLDVQSGETYAAFMQRATAAARTATQSTFDRNSSISDLSVVVTGQNQGSTVQVLTLRANRNQWRSNPNASRWTTYYPPAQSLLGLNPPPAPVVTTAVNAQPTTQPLAPRQPSQLRPTPNGDATVPRPRGLPPGAAIAPNSSVTITQPVNGTNSPPATTPPAPPVTTAPTLEQQLYPDSFPAQTIQSPQ